jgi:hypothetical protein
MKCRCTLYRHPIRNSRSMGYIRNRPWAGSEVSQSKDQPGPPRKRRSNCCFPNCCICCLAKRCHRFIGANHRQIVQLDRIKPHCARSLAFGGTCEGRLLRNRPPQDLEDDRGRPAEQQYAVHRGHRTKQAPSCDRNDVAISQCRVVDEGEIDEIAALGRGIDGSIGERPNENSRICAPISMKTVAIMIVTRCSDGCWVFFSEKTRAARIVVTVRSAG